MSVAALAALIGRPGLWRVAGVRVPVSVIDARKCFGRIDLKISPVDGDGAIWVQSDAVDLESLS